MDNTLPTVELIYELWAERFPRLTLPEDFLRSWLPHHTLQVISAFNSVAAKFKRYPGKNAMDVARMISGELRWSHVAHEAEEIDGLAPATEEAFLKLWQEHFPQFDLPSHFLETWVRNHRPTMDVTESFKVIQKTLKNCIQSKTTIDVCKLLTRKMSKLAIEREAMQQQRRAA